MPPFRRYRRAGLRYAWSLLVDDIRPASLMWFFFGRRLSRLGSLTVPFVRRVTAFLIHKIFRPVATLNMLLGAFKSLFLLYAMTLSLVRASFVTAFHTVLSTGLIVLIHMRMGKNK